MQIDSLLNLVYFVIGLAIGLLQLFLAQRQFEHQQKEKMDELRRSLAEIQMSLARLQETSSQRTFDIQDKLLGVAFRDQEIDEITQKTSERIRELVINELEKAGVPKAIENTKMLEDKLQKALELSAKSIRNVSQSQTVVYAQILTNRELQIVEHLVNNPEISHDELAEILSASPNTIRTHIVNIYHKMGVRTRRELIEKIKSQESIS